jgi:hypothetical protein
LQTDDILAWEDAVSWFVLTCPTAPAAKAVAPVDDLLKAYYAFAEPSMLVAFVDVTKRKFVAFVLSLPPFLWYLLADAQQSVMTRLFVHDSAAFS